MQKKVNIKNKYDKNLSVIIETPGEDIKDFIIVSHCFTCSKSYKLYNNIAKILVEKGYGVVRYDAMGLGNSGGDFSDTSFSTNVEDLITVYEYISEKYKKSRYLFGHSIGSLVSIKASNILDSVKGVVTVGSPADFDNVVRLFSNYEDELRENDNIEISLAGRSINIGRKYLEEARKESIGEIIGAFNKSIIMFHSDSDRTVPYKDGLDLFNLFNSDKSFITLKGAGHLADKTEDAVYIGEILCRWMENI